MTGITRYDGHDGAIACEGCSAIESLTKWEKNHFMPVKIVETIASVATLDDGEIAVEFSNGEKALLDPYTSRQATTQAAILDELRREGAPAYVEVNEGYISRLLIPHVVTVKALHALHGGEFQVDLHPSHGRHLLIPTVAGYEHLLQHLEVVFDSGAVVFITETPETHVIFDVTDARNPKPPALGHVAPVSEFDLTRLRDVSSQRARMLFELICGNSCSLSETAGSPCMPFLYPDDGCDARAHEMCRLIIAAGEQPAKLWIKPSQYYLDVQTPNHPDCRVYWRWHVAPVLRVSLGHHTEIQVIDPSLFSKAVNKLTWKSRLNDEAATLVAIAHSVYDPEAGSVDPAYCRTDNDLRNWKLRLKERSMRKGPPPYNCP
jgi:hypothetical protein